MLLVFMFIFGFAGGGLCVFLALQGKRAALSLQKRKYQAIETNLRDVSDHLKQKQEDYKKQVIDLASRDKRQQDDYRTQVQELADRGKRQQEDYRTQVQGPEDRGRRQKGEEDAFRARVISYRELEEENKILKRDLRNNDLRVRKQELDGQCFKKDQDALEARCGELGSLYLKDNIKWIGSSLSANNYAAQKQKLLDVIGRCRGVGLEVAASQEEALVADLKNGFEKMVRAQFEREEQARIKAQIREEQKLEKEVERELKQLERERAAIQAALEKALAEAKDQHSEEVERLKARLAEAEEKSRRAISMAQQTKSGYIYVISNIGSFGYGVFKIGMTRRLDPMERVHELGNASVPFPFDVHMQINSNDAPKLENAIHRALHKLRVNKTNPRKEYFKTDIESIRKIVEENYGEVQYVADAEALEYRQSQTMTEEDQEFIEEVFDKVEDETDSVGEV